MGIEGHAAQLLEGKTDGEVSFPGLLFHQVGPSNQPVVQLNQTLEKV